MATRRGSSSRPAKKGAPRARRPRARRTEAGTVERLRRELARSEDALRRRDAFFRAVLRNSPDVASVIGPDATFTFVSDFAKKLGYPEEGVKVFTKSHLVHPDDLPPLRQALSELLGGTRREANAAYRIRLADGSWRVLALSARAALDDPDVRGVVINTRDVTEQRELEERLRQSQRLEAVGRLAGGVAHDFNNVLTVILTCGAALQAAADAGEPASPEDVSHINLAAARARDITRQLLAFARRQVIAPEALDLNRILEGSRGMLARLLGENVELSLELAPGLWPVWADAAQVDQILLNLVANSRDALPRGGRVRIATANVDGAAAAAAWPEVPARDLVRLEVSDDGVGMSPEELEHAFEPFFTTKEVGKGTGLGLATVHGIVVQSGGRIRVESAPGRGSRFEIVLPRSAVAAAAAEERGRAERPAGGTETILLVEDDAAVRQLALRSLAGAGHAVHVAADGMEALALASTLPRPPDLLLTDVIMPRLDGARLAEALRARWPGLPVLFTSGYSDERLDAAGISRQGADLLQKPFTGAALVRAVRAVLDRRLSVGGGAPRA